MSPVVAGFLGSLAAGGMTAVGALPMLLGARPGPRAADVSLGFAAGVMLAASFFSLLVPAVEAAGARYGEGAIPAAIAVGGFVLGAAFVALLDRWAPHEHFIGGREGPDAALSRVWLFTIAIAIHNLPEGLAVGVGFADDDPSNGRALAVGIGLQNAPEGLAVAAALAGEGYRRTTAVAIAGATGLVEPFGGLIGAGVVSVSTVLLPWGLAFAAGAMLYVISAEIIPETHRRGHQGEATAGLVVGLAVMMFLDVAFG